VREAFARIFAAVRTSGFDSARHFVAGDRGVSEWIFTARRRRQEVEVSGCDLSTFRNGRSR